MPKVIRNFLKLIDKQTIGVTSLALLSTFVCWKFGWAAKMPTALISVAIIFPIVFSINAAYRRREDALKSFATVKALCVALYFTHKDWCPDDNPSHVERVRRLTTTLLGAIKEYFRTPGKAEEEPVQGIYRIIAEYSVSMEELRKAGLPAGEVSRANQYLGKIMVEFEKMRNILLYRTPLLLRAYSQVFLNSFPILFGPYFAYVCNEYYPALGYGVAIIYSLVLVSLDNIQEQLENPYNGDCEDDVDLDVMAAYEKVISSSG